MPLDAVTPHLTGLKSGSRAVGVLRQVRIFTDFLERTLSPEQKAAQKVIATNGPLGSLLAAAAGVLKTMPESTLTQAISLVSKGVGQPALASASALWAASLQGQAVSAMASNTDLSGPAMASAGEGSGVATRRRGRVARR